MWLECARESLVKEHGVQLGPVYVWGWFGISRQGVEYVLEQGEAAWAGPTPLPRPTAGDLKVLRVVRAAGKIDSKKLPALLKVKPTTGALSRFPFDGSTGAEIDGNIITLHLVDGGRGDADGLANGVILD
ncbi:MAG: hypothetical protein L0Z62_23370, partial [Gemmataceae bacterium]|nr:hypothetical protein [Gemmataceae bacterium]